jgi:hypothetical protein
LDIAYFPVQLKVIDAVAAKEKRNEFAYIFNHELGLYLGRLIGCGLFIVLARGTPPLVCRQGDRVRIRFGNLSAMDHHPIHLHGHYFKIVATDGGQIPISAQWPETTVLVSTGSTRDVELIADAPGDWAMHCHMTHHVMNQMGHGVPNMIGVKPAGLDRRVGMCDVHRLPAGDVQAKRLKRPPINRGLELAGLHGQIIAA